MGTFCSKPVVDDPTATKTSMPIAEAAPTIEKMFTPVKLGELELKNRFVLASLTRARSGASRVPNDANVEYYKLRAGFGLVLTEATTVCHQGEGWAGSASCYTDEQMAGWKKVVDAVHAEGGTIALQLWHTGRAGHTSFVPDGQFVSASNVPIVGDGVHTATGPKQPHEVPRGLTEAECATVVEDFGKAAERCKAVGFDGVEIHMANGYLLDQFIQTCSNDRSDKYGGTVEKRFLLPREVLERVLTVYPAGRVGVKLSPNGAFNGMGSPDNLETFKYVLKELDTYKLAFCQVMDSLAFGFHDKCPAMLLPTIKKHYSGNIMCNCGYTPEMAEEAVTAGGAECVSFGRPTLANPDYVARLKNGWPINEMLPMEHWYTGDEEHSSKPHLGYSDIPKYTPPTK